MSETEKPNPNVPESKVTPRKRGGISIIWLIPLIAALAGAWVGINTIRNQGPKITLIFPSAEGLEATKTKIRCNGIDVGLVTSLRLSDDHEKIIATAQMAPKTDNFLVKDTEFWVVRPQISGATISGLGTLISGAYIGMDIGKSTEPVREYTVLADAPLDTGGVHGTFYTLTTPDIGSINRGTPIYYRHLSAGQVVSHELNKDAKTLTVKIFVREPYDKYIFTDTRFWQASGLDVSLSANGLKVQTESFLSILVGGIAFETPISDPAGPAAAANSNFTLYRDRTEAFRPPPFNPTLYTLVFKEGLRGVSAGAPVELNGIAIGEVSDVRAQFDPQTYEFSAPITIQVDPRRFGVNFSGSNNLTREDMIAARRKVLDTMVARGLRAQLRSGSFVTGAKYVALDFYPDAPPATLDWSQDPVQLPTQPGSIESLEASVGKILKKVDALPFEEIGENLKKTLSDLDKTVVTAQGTLTNADQLLANGTRLIAPDAALDVKLGGMLDEVGGAARAMRLLADYLERHPESLIHGKSGDGK
jgi:paraquat-inducible protein B